MTHKELLGNHCLKLSTGETQGNPGPWASEKPVLEKKQMVEHQKTYTLPPGQGWRGRVGGSVPGPRGRGLDQSQHLQFAALSTPQGLKPPGPLLTFTKVSSPFPSYHHSYFQPSIHHLSSFHTPITHSSIINSFSQPSITLYIPSSKPTG